MSSAVWGHSVTVDVPRVTGGMLHIFMTGGVSYVEHRDLYMQGGGPPCGEDEHRLGGQHSGGQCCGG